MKKKIACFLTALTALTIGGTFFGCGMGAGSTTPDYNADIQVVAPESIPHENFVAEEDKTYYTSDELQLSMEVNGVFFTLNYFYLDGNKRVYDNLYLYEDDYFYMLTGNYKHLYASLGDSTDTQYAEEEKEQGEDIQINVKKSGIYKLIFDVDTLKFDVEYKSEIQTPVYYPIKNCQIYSVATEWVDMSVNPANADEFVINDFHIGVNEFISFQDRTHTSMYKVTVDESQNEKYGSYKHPSLVVNVGGRYNIYVNAKTYVVRFELLNPDTASYSCVYYDGKDFIELEPYEADTPYIFRQRIVVDTNYTTSLPKFHTAKYRTYALTVVDTTDVLMSSGKNYYFKKMGTYDIIVNLKTFEITAELLPE